MCLNNTCPDDNIFWKHEQTTDKLTIEGIYGNYDDNGYTFYINPNDLNRTDFNNFLNGIRENSINNSGCKIITVDLNVYHCQIKAIIKVTIIFEFSTLGDNNVYFQTSVKLNI